MNVEGKVAIITGAGTGVGRATALALSERGCSVIINYRRSEAEAEQVAAQVEANGVGAMTFQADVSDDEACRAMVQAAVARFGRLDILVNNAGTTRSIPYGDLEAVTSEVWDEIMGVNVRGAFQCARAARVPLEENGGDIINVSSVAGLSGMGSSIPYAASKAALVKLTVSLARALAPRIRVNAVAPGFITGRWCQELMGDEYEAKKQIYADQALLKSVCEPEDIAAVILGLITGSDIVTGQCITCDAGLLLGS